GCPLRAGCRARGTDRGRARGEAGRRDRQQGQLATALPGRDRRERQRVWRAGPRHAVPGRGRSQGETVRRGGLAMNRLFFSTRPAMLAALLASSLAFML